MRTAAFILFFAGMTNASLSQTNGLVVVERKNAPKEVLAAVTCDAVDNHVTRQAFAGGWLWQSKCPSNHANQIEAQVFSKNEDGKDAKLIRFPAPHPGANARLEEISNAEVFPTTREFNHLFVDPENKRVCRTEARWIARDPLRPQLVFWRETKDCDGKKGWRVLVNRK